MSASLAELVAASPVALPPGRLVVPEDGGPSAYWLSDETVDAGLVAALRRAGGGLQPLMCGGLGGPGDSRPWVDGEVYPADMTLPDGHDAGALLAGWWAANAHEDSDTLAPFGAAWPGPAAPGKPFKDPDRQADELAAELLGDPLRLGLVAAGSGAEALAVAGWSGPMNFTNDTGEIAAVVRSWEERFGARVVGAGFDTLQLSVGAPPLTPDDALRVAAEHFAFCPDLVDQGTGTLLKYAEVLLGATSWWFWWD